MASEPAGVANSVDSFARTLRRLGRSPDTIASYRWALDSLVRYLAERQVLAVDELTRELLEDWQDHLVERGLKPKSRSLAAVAARGWLRWLDDRDLVDRRLLRAVVAVRTPRGRPHPISPEHLAAIKAYLAPRRPEWTTTDLRDRALFFLLLASGARISEALQLRRQLSEQLVIQKGGTEKRLLITPTVTLLLEQWLAARWDHEPWLFVTTDTNRPVRRMEGATAGRAWIRLARRIGLPAWTSHAIRHTTATEMYRAGVPEMVIADHLGHHNLATIHNYAQIVDEQRALKLRVLEGLVAFTAPAGHFRPAVVKGRPDRRRPRS